MYLYICQH